jgi:hypothetical protein
MNKEFILYEQAFELKELGFDEPCIAIYNTVDKLLTKYSIPEESNDETDFVITANDFNDSTWVTAPLYQQAFRWFREKYNITHLIKKERGLNYEYDFNDGANNYYGVRDTYEEAELACLKKLIEIVKNK